MENEIINLELTISQVNHVLAVLGEAPFVKSVDPITWIREQAIPQHAEIAKKYPTQEEANAEAA